MQDRILTTQFGQYSLAPWDGVNRSGMRALCDKVLVLCDEPLDVTKGGIMLAEVSVETQKLAATSGVLVSVGPQAFAYDSNRLVHWEGERPGAGTRVFFVKYAGQEYTGIDGLLYRMMDDRAIGGMEEIPMDADEALMSRSVTAAA
jgi:co-chaperonin GroES (HSP10)